MENEFNTWVGQWEKALADGVFNNIEKEKSVNIDLPKNSKESFFGNLEINTDSEPSEGDVEYWNDINNYSESEITMLNESKKEKKDYVNKLTNSPNPIAINTVGKDSNKFSKTFLDDNINKLAELKDKMYKLENEVLTKETLGKEYKKAEKALKKMKALIDELSDSLTPERFGSETSES